MYTQCHAIGCSNNIPVTQDFCSDCLSAKPLTKSSAEISNDMANQYPEYYKPVGDLQSVDVYAIHKLFNIQDPSGCIQHASKKLLLSGVRTGGKSKYKDVKEARDTLTRWLDLYSDT
jgi:hypothetical protein